MNEKNSKLSRRNFLLSVGAGGVGGAAALIAKRGGSQGEQLSNDKRDGRGYHATEHVNNYYRTTKV